MTGKDLTAEDRHRLSGHVEEIVRKRAYSREDLLRAVRDRVVAHSHPDAPPRDCRGRRARGAARARSPRRGEWHGAARLHVTGGRIV